MLYYTIVTFNVLTKKLVVPRGKLMSTSELINKPAADEPSPVLALSPARCPNSPAINVDTFTPPKHGADSTTSWSPNATKGTTNKYDLRQR